MLDPLIDAAFEGNGAAETDDDRGLGQIKEADGKQPEDDLRATLLGGEAGKIEADDDQNLHEDEVTQLQFALEAMIFSRHEPCYTMDDLAKADCQTKMAGSSSRDSEEYQAERTYSQALDTRQALHYGFAMTKRQDTSGTPESRDPGPGYRLDSRGRQGAEDDRLALLEHIFDPLSRQRRELVQPGWRCLDVGAGRGSIALWLAERVGENGHVVATDIDITYLKELKLSNLEVRRHDILEDPLDTLGPGSFDLVCSRFMLFWLAGKQERAVRRMVECLRPGGWLVDEEGDWGMVAPVDPSHPHAASYDRTWRAGEWWTSRGYDPSFGRKLPTLFERCGLTNIRHEATAEVVRGDSQWASWWQQTLEAIRTWEQAKGDLSPAREKEYETLTAPWSDPSFLFLNSLRHACWGQRQ